MKNVFRRSSLSLGSSFASRSLNLGSHLLRAIPTKTTRLDNGLRVVSEENGGGLSTVGIFIGSGSAFEKRPADHGALHFVEHMMFKGTKNRSKEGFEMEIEDMGASFDAFTARETITFRTQVLEEDLEKGIEILEDILHSSTISQYAIDSEKSTIQREMLDIRRNSSESIFDLLHNVCFPDSSLGRTILGTSESVQSMTRKQLLDYHRTHYFCAPRMLLLGTGAVNHERMVELAQKIFTKLPPSPPKDLPPYPTATFQGGWVYEPNEHFPEAHVAVAFDGVPWGHPDYPCYFLINHLVGNWDIGCRVTSPLSARLADEQLAHGLLSFLTCYFKVGLFGSYIKSPPEKIHMALFAFFQYLHELRNSSKNAHPDFVSDLELAKSRLKTSIIMNVDGSIKLYEDIGMQILGNGRRISIPEMFLRIDSVTPNDIARVLEEKFFDVQPAVAALGDLSGMPPYESIRSWTFLQ